MKRLVWSPRSRDDLLAIAAHYDGVAPEMVDDMLQRIETAPTPLLDFPEIGSLTAGGARKWRAPKTPYLLIYDVNDDAVEVVAVEHVRSNWQR